MTKFIDINKGEQDLERITAFTGFLDIPNMQWRQPSSSPKYFDKIIYLGESDNNTSLFAAYKKDYKGVKGDEF